MFWASAAPVAAWAPAKGACRRLYLHGVPTTLTNGCPSSPAPAASAPDLPGFGRSGKPGSLHYTIAEYDDFLERLSTVQVGVERVSLVMSDWGAVGLAFAQRRPELIERLVVINAVPFLPGYRWHRTARAWRTPLLGELAMGCTGRFTLRLSSKQSQRDAGTDARGVARQRA